MITNYNVTGMTCDHCVNAVKEELSNLDGVTEVTVDVAGPVSITSDSEVDFEQVKYAVGEAGEYEVSIVND